MRWMIGLAACRHTGTEAMEAAKDAEAPSAWQCTAFVARENGEQPITVTGVGESVELADKDAWQRACEALPPSVPPSPCELEAPPDMWTWTRTLEEGEQKQVTLVLQSSPVPYQGSASSPVSQDAACAQAYAQACAEAGAEPGCQTQAGFVDGGIGAIEQ